MYKIVLLGSPSFVVKFFDSFVKNDQFEVIGVVTKISKVKKKYLKTELSDWAKQNNIMLFQVSNINKDENVKNLIKEADLCLLFAFGQIISENLLKIPKFGWLNIHPSKLPMLRGPSPIQYALLNGLKQSALTLMIMNNKMDEGDIIAQKKFALNVNHNINAVFYELSNWGPNWVLENTLQYLRSGITIAQDHLKATYCNFIKKNDYEIAENLNFLDVINKIRALKYVNMQYKNWKFKCFVAKKYEKNDYLDINGVCPVFIQLPSKKIMHIRNFYNGYLRQALFFKKIKC